MLRLSRRGFALGALVAVAGALVAAPVAAQPVAPGPLAQAEQLAVLVGRPGGTTTAAHLVALPRAGGGAGPLALGAPVATLTHLPLATVRAAAAGDAVMAVVDEASRGDRSFASALFRVRAGRAPERLLDRVVHASRPLPRPGTSEVLVARGEAAIDPATGLRDDRLTIEAVDAASGARRVVARGRGNLLFPAAIVGSELVIYRVDTSGSASLLAVELDPAHQRAHQRAHPGGHERELCASLPPFARDFSADARGAAVVFLNRHPTDSARWVIDTVALADGSTSRLHEDPSMQLAPHVWPDGSLALTRDPKVPLERLDLGRGAGGPAPRGVPAGLARVEAISADRQVALASSVGGGLPAVSVVDAATGAVRRLVIPHGQRATIAGFVDAPGAATQGAATQGAATQGAAAPGAAPRGGGR